MKIQRERESRVKRLVFTLVVGDVMQPLAAIGPEAETEESRIDGRVHQVMDH